MARKPRLSRTSAPSVLHVGAIDENGKTQQIGIAGEYPLTLYVDGREIITLMTLGQMPEALAVGWLRNQRLVESVADIEEVLVDWEVNAAAVYTRNGMSPLPDKRATTSGCGQGTMFGDLMTAAQKTPLRRRSKFTATALAQLLADLRRRDTVYKSAGSGSCLRFGDHSAGHLQKRKFLWKMWGGIMRLMPLPAGCGSMMWRVTVKCFTPLGG